MGYEYDGPTGFVVEVFVDDVITYHEYHRTLQGAFDSYNSYTDHGMATLSREIRLVEVLEQSSTVGKVLLRKMFFLPGGDVQLGRVGFILKERL